MLEFAPIMPAFCWFLLYFQYSNNFAGKINASLIVAAVADEIQSLPHPHPVTVIFPESHPLPFIAAFTTLPEMQCIIQAEQQRQAKICSVMAVTDPAVEIIKDAVIPLFSDLVTFEYSDNIPPVFFQVVTVVTEYKQLF